MHPSAMSNGKLFFDTYVAGLGDCTVVDIGAQDVNGSLRQACPPNAKYIGVDFEDAKGVDIVIDDPYVLPFEAESVDVVVSSSCFEHSEMFWLVFLDVLRVLKPNGLFYLNVPSNGAFHRYPVDCWRFYPDSGNALVAWARRCSLNPALLESFTTSQYQDIWNDFVAVFVKDKECALNHSGRMLSASELGGENSWTYGQSEIGSMTIMPEDVRRTEELRITSSQAAERCNLLTHDLESARTAIEVKSEQLAESRFKLDASQRELAELKSKIHVIENSRSWRLTAPLRKLGKLFH